MGSPGSQRTVSRNRQGRFEHDADRHLEAITGVSEADPPELYRKLEEDQVILAQVALDFPNRAHTADTLVRSRTRMLYEHTEPQPNS